MVYALLHNSLIVYVGYTHNIEQRLTYHCIDKVFDSHFVIDATGSREVEYICIDELRPYYNKRTLNVKYAISQAMRND